MNLFLFGRKWRRGERAPARWQNKAEFIFSLLADDEIFFIFGRCLLFCGDIFGFSLIFGGKCRRVEYAPARCAENKKMAGKLMLFNAADDIFPLSAGVMRC